MREYSVKHPRPDFRRDGITLLTGKWEFTFDKADEGKKAQWYSSPVFHDEITVPYPVESELSGVRNTCDAEVFWYSRKIKAVGREGRRVFLCFGAVDYRCEVYIDGKYIGFHEGGYSYFEFDITGYLKKDGNVITLRVEDRLDPSIPRGKQYWSKSPDRCWYTPVSGIWQPVWLEERGDVYIESVRITPDIDNRMAHLEALISGASDEETSLHIEITKNGKTYTDTSIRCADRRICFSAYIKEDDYIDETHHWTPDNPQLYEVKCTLETGKSCDTVSLQFGMRKISVSRDRILLNNKPFFQRLVLDQGYFPESIYTAVSDDDFINDIKLIKALGFNGVRMHQKVEDPRFYYYCDKLGLAVWLEMPSMYSFSGESARNLEKEWGEIILQHYNHPCIIAYAPLNESWGVRNIYSDDRQQNFALSLYHMTKALDPTRFVSTNDGWEQVLSDVCAIHDYCESGEELALKLGNFETLAETKAQNRMVYADGFGYGGEPVIISEFGGIAFSDDAKGECWGYGGSVNGAEDYFRRLSSVVNAIVDSRRTCGYCYTQFTDVFQEVNGLVTIDRKVKTDLSHLNAIFTRTVW